MFAQSGGTAAGNSGVQSQGGTGESASNDAVSQEQAANQPAPGSPAGDQSSQLNRIDESLLTLDFQDDDEAVAVPGETTTVFGIWELLRMVLVLAIVVGMIYGLFFLLKRGKKAQDDHSSFISVLTSQTLPGGKQLHIIDVAGQVYLLGAADGGINLITEISDKPTIDELRLQASRQQLQGGNFSQMISGFFSRNSDSGGTENEPAEVGFDFVHRQRERLKKL